jgi:hypothetical protein
MIYHSRQVFRCSVTLPVENCMSRGACLTFETSFDVKKKMLIAPGRHDEECVNSNQIFRNLEARGRTEILVICMQVI